MVRLIRSLRRERYDIAIDLMDNPSATSTLFCVLAGARWSIGLEKENAFAYDVRVPLLSRRDVHIVRRIAELLRPFGIDPSAIQLRMCYIPDKRSISSAEAFLRDSGGPNGVLLGINMSAGSKSRYWGSEKYAQLVSRIGKAWPSWKVFLFSKPGDEAHAVAVAKGQKNVRVVTPSDRFMDFAALLGRMSVLITPDTAAVHLASANGIPCVVMYVQMDTSLRIWDPYDTPHRALLSRTDTLESVTVTQVFDALSDLCGETYAAEHTRRPAKKGRIGG
jgi:ADP-heptose:LPS heptosyltransferase